MEGDPYSLNNLRDIVVPQPPSFWPPAAGLWVLLALCLAVGLCALWQWRAVRKRNAYRRAGLLLLGEAQTAYDVSVVMKRVALAVFPREQVAALYGKDWAAFLQASCPGNSFDEIALADPGSASNQKLVELAALWIQHHQLSATGARVAG